MRVRFFVCPDMLNMKKCKANLVNQNVAEMHGVHGIPTLWSLFLLRLEGLICPILTNNLYYRKY